MCSMILARILGGSGARQAGSQRPGSAGVIAAQGTGDGSMIQSESRCAMSSCSS